MSSNSSFDDVHDKISMNSGGSRISLRWGRQLSRGRHHTILPNFPKICMKLKELGPGGSASLAPPYIRH